MNSRNTISSPESQQGVMLLESMIAVLIFSLGVLGIIGLQAAMIKSTSDAKYRSDASYIAQQKIGAMWADPTVLPDDLDDIVDISSQLPGGFQTVVQTAVAGQFVVRVGWTAPGETPAAAVAAPCFMLVAHCFTTTASIAGG